MEDSVPGDVRAKLPPVVYVPCRLRPSHDDGRLLIEFREGRDGSTTLPVYTALDRLVRCCGEGQPWAVLSVAELAEIDAQAPYDTIAIDAELPATRRKGGR
jgi:hypothetical protein